MQPLRHLEVHSAAYHSKIDMILCLRTFRFRSEVGLISSSPRHIDTPLFQSNARRPERLTTAQVRIGIRRVDLIIDTGGSSEVIVSGHELQISPPLCEPVLKSIVNAMNIF